MDGEGGNAGAGQGQEPGGPAVRTAGVGATQVASRPAAGVGSAHADGPAARPPAQMVDIGGRQASVRSATAVAVLDMAPETLRAIRDGAVPKGDVCATARVAGIQAAKRCPDWLPLCHPIPLDSVAVDFGYPQPGEPGGEQGRGRLEVRAVCRSEARTGVEMEALCAVSCAALCVYDMCKALDPGMRLAHQAVLEKRGGRGGDWSNPDPQP